RPVTARHRADHAAVEHERNGLAAATEDLDRRRIGRRQRRHLLGGREPAAREPCRRPVERRRVEVDEACSVTELEQAEKLRLLDEIADSTGGGRTAVEGLPPRTRLPCQHL